MDVVAAARRLLESGPVCDSCLGRPFADRSFGLTNEQRGRSLRTAVALADDADFESGPTADCWVCEGHCAEHDAWAERVVDAAADYDFDTYQVGTRTPPLIEENDRLLREEAGLDPDAGEAFKSAFNREVGKRFGREAGAEVDFDRPDVLALLNLERGDVDVQVNPAFVYGRYRKLERDVPQTEWPCRECGGSGKQLGEDGEEDCEYCDGTGYMYPTSVEQEIAPLVRDAMEGEEALFHGAGREDVDALMLGTGRPFVVEVKRPHRRSPDVEALEAEINDAAAGRVEVEGLRLATYEMVERVKELDASKRYRAYVATEAPLDDASFADALAELDGETVEQYTPERVDHRRASTTRTRTVYEIDGELHDSAGSDGGAVAPDAVIASRYEDELDLDAIERTGTVEIHGEGGLYVKELISGDEGRTEPSLAGLLDVPITVTALDVLAVEGEEESFEDEAYFRD
ncbi:pseudouridylate synthase [Salinarchaeum sp. Harcht-Bsk1]|uniref:tRNA pseudouridine(54/55) synthase Pus10 n=1 Tax=Salinarchaeum sp. Harcht-Bsk1 TaxID=1333523 RepID=UPI000342476F|nr:tRNA pseudouridine(54/55) synthase Pus10 [Salinarchaeum sp. Harcht-Bsk1]AGN02800.1 pseudouridylate synthase [Salinarchaeum sp. Harcht-Bsk1]